MADQWKNPPSDEDVDEPIENEELRGRADEQDDDFVADEEDLDEEEDEESTTF